MIYFAGDFHLGVDGQTSSLEREKKICHWLDEISNDAEHIYLLGDVFDYWFEYKRVVPKGHVRFLGKLAEIAERCPITVFRGNHDLWMKDYLPQECGVQVLTGPLEVEHYGKKIYLHHGDGLGPGDRAYKWLRKLFHASWAQSAFASLPINWATGLAQSLSRKSRSAQAPPAFQQNQKEQLFVYCEGLISQGHQADFYVFGHRHLTLDLVLSNASRYINPGTWLGEARFARLDPEGNLRLMAFN